MTTLTTSELVRCLTIALEFATSRGFESIDCSRHDQYWVVAPPNWVKFDIKPDLGVGSLSDDLSELRQLLANPSRVSVLDLERVAFALLLLSQTIEDRQEYLQVP